MRCRRLSFEGLVTNSTVRVLTLRSQCLTQELAVHGEGVPGWFRRGTDSTVHERVPSLLLLGTPLEGQAEGHRRRGRRHEWTYRT
jgi:hypothetical protein